jgi:hypothetical protein
MLDMVLLLVGVSGSKDRLLDSWQTVLLWVVAVTCAHCKLVVTLLLVQSREGGSKYYAKAGIAASLLFSLYQATGYRLVCVGFACRARSVSCRAVVNIPSSMQSLSGTPAVSMLLLLGLQVSCLNCCRR